MKIEQICHYLPYGLNIEILNYKRDYVGIRYAKLNGFYFIGDSLHFTYEGGSTGKDVSSFKPILRPMSDFSLLMVDFLKEISLIDLSECKFEIGQEPEYYVNAIDKRGVCIDFIDFDNDNWICSNYENDGQKTVNPIDQVNSMLKFHLDVFGLIDAGLAIDINTVPELLNT